LFGLISTRERAWLNLSLSSDMYKGVSPPCEWDIQSNPVIIHSFPSLLMKSLIVHSLSFPSQVYEVLVPCTPRCKLYFLSSPLFLVLAYITSHNVITTSTDYLQIKIPTIVERTGCLQEKLDPLWTYEVDSEAIWCHKPIASILGPKVNWTSTSPQPTYRGVGQHIQTCMLCVRSAPTGQRGAEPIAKCRLG